MGFYRPKNRPKKGKPATRAGFNQIQADRTGLEPATSAVTGRHSNQLNYRSNYLSHIFRYPDHPDSYRDELTIFFLIVTSIFGLAKISVFNFQPQNCSKKGQPLTLHKRGYFPYLIYLQCLN